LHKIDIQHKLIDNEPKLDDKKEEILLLNEINQEKEPDENENKIDLNKPDL